MFGNPDDNNGQPQAQTDQPPAGGGAANELPAPGAPPAPSGPDGNDTAGFSTGQPANASAPANTGSPDSDGLLNIKQQALQQLSPLVSHLDQKPEEEFRTTMMMIQASDNQSLVQKAYEAAQKIEDEKTRAQALLDIVNEINYFTQHQEDGSDGK